MASPNIKEEREGQIDHSRVLVVTHGRRAPRAKKTIWNFAVFPQIKRISNQGSRIQEEKEGEIGHSRVAVVAHGRRAARAKRTIWNFAVFPQIKRISNRGSGIQVRNGVVKRRNITKELYRSKLRRSENGLIATPVDGSTRGKGLPYAPENWPCTGDKWNWKVVGNISSRSGRHWYDRCLTPPSRFRDATGKSILLRSIRGVEKFILREFPDVEPDTFFSMFIWRIRAKGSMTQRGTQEVRGLELETPMIDLAKERNGFSEPSLAQDYHTFSTYPNFYPDSCCIICGKSVDNSFGGYSYIKCEAVVNEKYICGHVGHLQCAFENFLAGTVGGGTILDVQYYCRRCDNKTDLMMHVDKLLGTCRSHKSLVEIKPILDMGLLILSGSILPQAKTLENYMKLVMAKIKDEADLAGKMDNGDGMAILNAEEFSPPTANAIVLDDEEYPYETNPRVDGEFQRATKGVPSHS